MKVLRFLYLLLIINILSCSSDDKQEEPEVLVPTSRLVTSVTSDNPVVSFNNQFFTYDNGLLISSERNDRLEQYEYDDLGRLISGGSYDYFYDGQNRVVKRVVKNSDLEEDSTTLVYEKNKVTITYHIFGWVFVHTTDDLGRIIRIEKKYPEASYDMVEYTYDNNGNIIKESIIRTELNDVKENIYEYEDKINPYYDIYEKPYKSIYHIINMEGISVFPDFGNSTNIVKREGYNYIVDDKKYPIELEVTAGEYPSNWKFEYLD